MAARADGPRPPARVLIVDDTEDVRLLAGIVLKGEPDFEVCGEAVDGVDAVEKADDLRPDAILLDLAMPRMSGIDALRHLREIVPEASIVVFSGQWQAGEAAVAAGADAFVPKGGDLRDLAAALRVSAKAR